MKNLSNEELIGENRSSAEINANNIGKSSYLMLLEYELLRRLEHGDRAIKACKEIAAMEIQEWQ